MAKSPEPVVLELASLPREQMGPFLILGLDKAAPRAAVEEHWADRIKWARRSMIKVALEDINWAREVLSDGERRIKADAASLNSDTSDAVLAGLSRRYGLDGGQATRMWQPLDREKPLADYSPPAEVPEAPRVRETIRPQPVPEEIPAARLLLEGLAGAGPLDPWAIELPQPLPNAECRVQNEN
jgi:hypothetical protein